MTDIFIFLYFQYLQFLYLYLQFLIAKMLNESLLGLVVMRGES